MKEASDSLLASFIYEQLWAANKTIPQQCVLCSVEPYDT